MAIKNVVLQLGILFSCNNILYGQSLADTRHDHRMQSEKLSVKEQAIVTISAFTARGETKKLESALNNGLSAGLTINEIKEVLVQLYAYTGFPRSLNALNTLIVVLGDRKAKGTNDQLGREPSPLPTNKTRLEFGTEMQTKLVGRPIKGGVFEFAPAIDQYLKEHLFGAIFGRDNLNWKTRELATIAALAALGGVDSQLRSHFAVGMYNGLTEGQLQHLVSIIQSSVCSSEGNAANQVLKPLLKHQQDSQNQTAAVTAADQSSTGLFPKGEKIINNHFIGNAWLYQMTSADSSNPTSVGTVTFEAGARTNWHLHPGGQILVIISGTGYYQEKDRTRRVVRKGDVIKCPPNVQHWHGGSKEEELVQIAITNTQRGPVIWLQPVTDEEYKTVVRSVSEN